MKNDEVLISYLINKILDVFEKEIPPELMNSSKGTYVMYNTIINLAVVVSKTLRLNPKDVCKHIDKVNKENIFN